MPDAIEVLPDFPGFAVKYDLAKNPFFKPIVVENLRKLQEVEAGKTLLKAIGDARPRRRGDFPASINVMCIPSHIEFTQAGFKREVVYGDGGPKTTGMTPSDRKQYSPEGCTFWMAGGSSNEAVDQTAADDGNGTVCRMNFSNVQVLTSKGEKAEPFVVLAHELIHSLHCLQGARTDGKDEELKTTGIDRFANEPMSENVFRSQFGLPLRTKYF